VVNRLFEAFSARLIRVDQELSELDLKLWADAAKQANMAMFIRLPSNYQLPKHRHRIGWGLKRLLDWSLAALLLVALSPIMLATAVLIRVNMPGPILYRQWRVGQRGKLFQIINFARWWWMRKTFITR
jgi:lipopolysaccharide/colanic/teichoic acid biosynthesis glycosyltransferase